MRKIVKLVAVLAFTGLVLAGCGPKMTEAEKNAPPPAGPHGAAPATNGSLPGLPAGKGK